MVFTLSVNSIMKIIKILGKIIILTIIICYILPQLLNLLWYINYPEPKMRDEHFFDRPLKVMNVLLDVS